MVQVISNPYGGNVFGRLGAGIGKGISEELPKVVERERLASGLENLKNEKEPLKQYAGLIRSGADASQVNQLFPLLQAQGARQEALQNIPNRATSDMQSSNAPSASSGSYRLIGTPEAIRSEGARLSALNPAQFPTLESGVAEYEKRIANQEKQIARVDQRFQQVGETKLQKGGKETYADVLGDLQNTFRQKAEDDVLSGRLSDTQAAEKYTKEMLDFAKSRQNLKSIGGLSRFSTKPSVNKENLSQVRKEYEKVGQLESFADDLMSYHGLTDPYANYLTYPVSSNKEINNEISKLKRERRFNIFSETQERELADKFSKSIKSNDSPLAIALHLKEKGLDPRIFLNQFRKNYDQGKIPQMTERQARELEKQGNFSPSLGDLYLFAISGLDKVLEQK